MSKDILQITQNKIDIAKRARNEVLPECCIGYKHAIGVTDKMSSRPSLFV